MMPIFDELTKDPESGARFRVQGVNARPRP